MLIKNSFRASKLFLSFPVTFFKIHDELIYWAWGFKKTFHYEALMNRFILLSLWEEGNTYFHEWVVINFGSWSSVRTSCLCKSFGCFVLRLLLDLSEMCASYLGSWSLGLTFCPTIGSFFLYVWNGLNANNRNSKSGCFKLMIPWMIYYKLFK